MGGGVPVGFMFKPSDIHVLRFFLIPKIRDEPIPDEGDVHVANVYDYDPDDLARTFPPANGHTDEWWFFSRAARQHPGSTRLSRITPNGHWHSSQSTKNITDPSLGVIGTKQSLSFRRKPNQKTVWLMKEFAYKDPDGGPADDEYWVVCRIYLTPAAARKRRANPISGQANKKALAAAPPPPPAPVRKNLPPPAMHMYREGTIKRIAAPIPIAVQDSVVAPVQQWCLVRPFTSYGSCSEPPTPWQSPQELLVGPVQLCGPVVGTETRNAAAPLNQE